MSLLDLLKGNYDFHVQTWTPRSPQGSSWFREVHQQTAAGISVNYDSALNCSAALACTRAISETLASLPAVVQEQMSPDQRRKARENPMWALLHDQPNPEMDSMTWYGVNATRVINRGNSINLIEYNGRGLPIALWPVHNSRFEIWRNRSRFDGRRYFPGESFFRIWPDETERHFDVPPDEVLNIVGWDTDDGLVGRGVVSRMKQEIALDIAMQEYAATMFKNGALPLGLIKYPWIPDATERDNLRADINKIHSGRENWNKVGILWDKDADWIKLNFSPNDVQAIQSRVFSSKAICRGYNVPPAIVQIFDDYKFATIEAMLKHFIMLTIRPYAVRFERAINSQILSDLEDWKLILEFALEGLLRGDPEAQAKMNALYRSWGILNADEIRQRDLAMNPLPDGLGEVRLAPLNHAPLDLIAAGGGMKTAQPVEEGEPPEDDEDEDSEGNGEATRAKWDPAYVARLAGRMRSNRVRSTKAEPPDPVHVPTNEEYCRSVVQRIATKLTMREVSAIRHRVGRGHDEFLQWVDAYYEKFQCVFTTELAVACHDLSEDPKSFAGRIALQHVTASKELLLDACECKAGEFNKALLDCVSTWTTREIDWNSISEVPENAAVSN